MRISKYESRFKAGEILAEFIKSKNETLYNHILENPKKFFCFAIPNGGIPVVEGFCSKLRVNYDVLIVRKIKIPYNAEAGFGAVTPDGTVLFNQPLLNQLNLNDRQIEESIEITKEEISQRVIYYKKESDLEPKYFQHIHTKNIFLLDDGLASGFTMLAAISMVKKYNPEKIWITVPTAPLRTVLTVKEEVDQIYCPNIRDVMWFAVADAYKNWYDVPESEVLELINNSKFYISNL
jgi:predicted phosphoribosyltransferase